MLYKIKRQRRKRERRNIGRKTCAERNGRINREKRKSTCTHTHTHDERKRVRETETMGEREGETSFLRFNRRCGTPISARRMCNSHGDEGLIKSGLHTKKRGQLLTVNVSRFVCHRPDPPTPNGLKIRINCINFARTNTEARVTIFNFKLIHFTERTFRILLYTLLFDHVCQGAWPFTSNL